jgi:hypothetical protein
MSKSMREHAIATHVHEADHSVKMAKHCKAMSGHYSAVHELLKAKGEMEENPTAPVFATIADQYDQMSDDWTERADHHLQCCEDLGKATDADDLTKADLDRFADIRSDGVRGLLPEIPSNVRPVLRTGQRLLDELAKVGGAVDPQLVKVLGFDEEN